MHHISTRPDRSTDDDGNDDAGAPLETHERATETDENGTARTVFRYENDYETEPHVIVSSSDGIAEWTARGASQVTVTVRDAPPESDITVNAIIASGE